MNSSSHEHDPVAALMQPTVTAVVADNYHTLSKQPMQPPIQQQQPQVMGITTLTPTTMREPPVTEMALPDGWIEAVDPTSGNVYYYNQTTGVSY